MASSVTYLGYQINLEGLHPTEDKIRTIRDAPAPCNVTDVQSGTNLPQRPLYAAFHTKRSELSIKNGCLHWGS